MKSDQGKSLSIICGALRWLGDYNERLHKNLLEKIQKLEDEARKSMDDAAEVADWFSAKTREIELTRMLYAFKLEYNKLLEYDAKIEKLKTKQNCEKRKMWKHQKTVEEPQLESVDEEELILEDFSVLSDTQQSDEEDEAEQERKYEPIKVTC